MTSDDIIRILTRRWPLAVAIAVVALALGWISAPGAGSRTERYEATHVLLVDPQNGLIGTDNELNFEQAALLVTVGDVPDRAAERVGADDPAELARTVTAKPDEATGSLAITAVSPDPEEAAAVAEAFAEELITEVSEDDLFVYDARLADAQDRTTTLQQQLTDLQAQAATLREEDPDAPELRGMEANLTALAGQFQSAFAEVDTLVRAGPPRPLLTTLERPVAAPVDRQTIHLPDAAPTRAGMFAVFGLLAGAAVAVASARPDTRIRNRADAEASFGVPVLAEIPSIPGLRQGAELLAVDEPGSPYVEPFRGLSTVVLYAAATGVRGVEEDVAADAERGARPRGHVVLVTSPAASEGKTTTVANLAAVLAETGRRVLVVSADMRRPRVHDLFGVAAEPGIVDVLGDPTRGIGLADLRLRTEVPGVYLLPSGAPVDNPAPLLGAAVRLIASARSLFDFLIVDCPPVLVANDTTELAAAADTVVLLAWADRTTRDAADRSAEVLRRVGAPLLGSVIVAARESPAAYRYAYRSGYVGRRRREREAPPPSDDAQDEHDSTGNGSHPDGGAARGRRSRRRPSRAAGPTPAPGRTRADTEASTASEATADAGMAGAAVGVDLLDLLDVADVEAEAAPAPQAQRRQGIDIRPATDDDTPAVLDLLARCLRRDPADPRFAALHRWKHVENVFGPSPAWVAVAGGDVIGYRAFVRWELHDGARRWRAVRAVDTATHPDHQRRGVFRTLTMHALDALAEDSVDFVFNTPNDHSRPGYLDMGWQTVGTLTPWGMPSGVVGALRAARSRVPASHFGEPSRAGRPAAEVFADDSVADALLAALVDDGRLRTDKSPAWLRWRYGSDFHGYRVIALGADPAEGTCCVRVRRRGEATEAVLDELFVPSTEHRARRTLVRRVLHETGASSLVALGATPRDALVALPHMGPTLVWRPLPLGGPLPNARWALSMGDVESF